MRWVGRAVLVVFGFSIIRSVAGDKSSFLSFRKYSPPNFVLVLLVLLFGDSLDFLREAGGKRGGRERERERERVGM